jgi:glycosyltransferase involved in cell wall biosynthesis
MSCDRGGTASREIVAVVDQITALIITYNEAPNIRRALEKLRWAKRIVVIDSGSSDETLSIVAQYPQAELMYRSFDSFAQQCNFGLSQIQSEWVLSLDADYELSDELVDRIHTLSVEGVSGYRIGFVYRVYGRSLRGTIYPPRVVLYRAKDAFYENYGHGHRVSVVGEIRALREVIYHDDRKSLSRWFHSQLIYARREADFLLNSATSQLSFADRVRRLGWLAPFLVPTYALFAKGCILDGGAGWLYALQRLLAETIIALEIIDRRVRKAQKVESTDGLQ